MSTNNSKMRPFTDDTKIGDAAAKQPLSGTTFVTGTMLVHGLGHGAQMPNDESPKSKTKSQG